MARGPAANASGAPGSAGPSDTPRPTPTAGSRAPGSPRGPRATSLAFGLGVGTVVRSQVAATVGGLVWLMAFEDGVRGWLRDLGGYLPGQAGLAVATGLPGRAAAIAAVTLAGYAAVALPAGGMAIRRDVT